MSNLLRTGLIALALSSLTINTANGQSLSDTLADCGVIRLNYEVIGVDSGYVDLKFSGGQNPTAKFMGFLSRAGGNIPSGSMKSVKIDGNKVNMVSPTGAEYELVSKGGCALEGKVMSSNSYGDFEGDISSSD